MAPVRSNSACSHGQWVEIAVQGVSQSQKPNSSRSPRGCSVSHDSALYMNWFIVEMTDRLALRPTRVGLSAATSARSSSSGAGICPMRCVAARTNRETSSRTGASGTVTQRRERSLVQSTTKRGFPKMILACQSPRRADGDSGALGGGRRLSKSAVQRRIVTGCQSCRATEVCETRSSDVR